ncbi:hypothetical protein GE09DRAFT_787428 [Coniochaeta sp. 2T2.1]|nr:hypothetical protein GE09DRAFT_787428 [Coniochaeta sp. 2T2.1]
MSDPSPPQNAAFVENDIQAYLLWYFVDFPGSSLHVNFVDRAYGLLVLGDIPGIVVMAIAIIGTHFMQCTSRLFWLCWPHSGLLWTHPSPFPQIKDNLSEGKAESFSAVGTQRVLNASGKPQRCILRNASSLYPQIHSGLCCNLGLTKRLGIFPPHRRFSRLKYPVSEHLLRHDKSSGPRS